MAATLVRALRRAVGRNVLTPVVCGSAITGAGTTLLGQVLTDLVSRPVAAPGPLAGSVFAVDRDERGRRSWARLWSGELRVRDRVDTGVGRPQPVTELAVSQPVGLVVEPVARAGQIAVVRGLTSRIGDALGRPPGRRAHSFPPATLQALVEPEHPRQRTALFTGLTELADEDPLIDVRTSESDGEVAVSLHGEVQKEVIAALLAERYGVRTRFLETSVVCIERVVGTGSSVERIMAAGNPYLAGIGLRVEAAPAGHGVQFLPGIERGNLPPAFIAATEEGVRSALRQGLHGWSVTDCMVTMTASQYFPRQSKPHQKFDKSISSVAADFRHLTPVVVMAALQQAGTRVCQPVDQFELDIPDEALGPVAAMLGQLGAAVLGSGKADGYTRLTGHLPAKAVPVTARRLPDLTSGEGALLTRLDHYAPVAGERPPSRRRTGLDPRDRATWFRQVPR